jgi:alkanesulfonate monooxygenase SsuD/methylene tetrahydromethanopterin reductase-like flavin-dependent oxidoreductase (luciferase family)
VLTYDFRLPPGPRTVEYALLAEELGFRAVWCPEIPAFGHDIWVALARIAEKTKRIKFGPSVLIPSYRPPMAQASAIATLEQLAPGRLMVGFGTGFTGRAGMGAYPRRDMPGGGFAHRRAATCPPGAAGFRERSAAGRPHYAGAGICVSRPRRRGHHDDGDF